MYQISNSFKKLLIMLLAFFVVANAQINFKTSKQQLYTGERFKVEMQLVYPSGVTIDSSFYKIDKSSDFDKISDSLISLQKTAGKITEKRIFTYSAFADSGDHNFALPTFRYVNNGQTVEIKSDSVQISVLSLLSANAPAYADSLLKKVANPKDSSQMILPIKNIANYKLSTKEKWLIFWFIIGLLLAIGIVYFIMRNKKHKVAPVVQVKAKVEPAHIIAMRELMALKEAKLPQNGEFKEYAIRLSLIIREYLENRYEFNAAELTSYELKLECRKYLNEQNLHDQIDILLDQTDLIKFAKLQPTEKELDQYFEQATKIVELTRNDNNNKISL